MKKKTLILLSAAMIMMLASCGDNESSDPLSSIPASTTSSSTTSAGSSDTPSAVNYGTEEAPLTVASLKTEAAKLNLADKSYSASKFYVKDVVDAASNYLTLTGNVRVYDFSSEEKNICQNDTVLVEGYIQCSGEYFNFAKKEDDQPVIKSVTKGQSKVTVTVENGKVNGLNESYTNGETASFTVDVDTGYELKSVSAYGTDLTATDGTYSFIVKGDVSVLVTIAQVGAKTWQKITSAPVVGTAYRAGLDHTGIENARVYLDGSGKDDRYINLVADETKAATVIVETNGDGFNIKVGSNYLIGYQNGKYSNIKFSATVGDASPWLWDGTYNSFTTLVGTYKIFVGVGLSDTYMSLEAKGYSNKATSCQHLNFYEEK